MNDNGYTQNLKWLRGCYMAGVIDADVSRCDCGGDWQSVVMGKYEVPSCTKCNQPPVKYRIRRFLPGLNGKAGKRLEIRYDNNQIRLTDIHDAIATMKQIDRDITSGAFDPRDYGSKEAQQERQFNHFVENSYLSDQETMKENKEITKSTLKIKKGLCTNHLIPYFKDKDMRSIKEGEIIKFYRSYKKTLRQRELATAELRVILKDAKIKNLINVVPDFPTLKKAKYKNPETFYSRAQQTLVISKMTNPKYKAATMLLARHLLRPCDIRAVLEGDVYITERIIKIERHFSDNELADGRKSSTETHYVRIDEESMAIIKPWLTGNPTKALFSGARGKFMSEKVLSNDWKNAVESIDGLPYIDLYTGTKSSSMTYLLSEGYSIEEIMSLSGHTTLEAAKRYGQRTQKLKLQDQDKILAFKKGG